jgi:HlyD family secretion protein
MTATVSVVTERRNNVLAVPNAALRFRPEGAPPPGAGAGAAPGQSARQGQPGAAGGEGNRRRERDRSRDGDGDGDGERRGPPKVVKRTVYVLAEDEPVPREVITGLTDGRLTEITGGELKEGEQVIVGVVGQGQGQGQRGQQRGPRIL